ncbi:MAG: DNA polymerase IV [Bacteroidota bacterium]
MASRSKHIAHLDLDCFFVSVERTRNPDLIGKPTAVGGSPQGRGVVTSASYEARAFGVHSAMPASQALRLCPHLIFVRSHHRDYGEISDRLYHRMLELSPVVERASIDEMYLDFTGCESLYGNDLSGFMKTIQKLVREEFGLPCSLALASSKTVAKIAVGTVKPEGICTVSHGEEKRFLAPLPIKVIPGVGKKTEEYLHTRGFQKVSDLQAASESRLVELLGTHGSWLYNVAQGKGSDTVSTGHARKSIGHEQTFARDIGEPGELEEILFGHTEQVCSTLRSKGWKARTIGLKLRYADFRTITRSRTIDPTDDDPVVFRTVRELFRSFYNPKMKVRLLGVQLSNLDDIGQLELSLHPDEARRKEVLRAVERIRAKHGDDAIHLGGA